MSGVMKPPLEELRYFMRRVDTTSSACWLWAGAQKTNGYCLHYFNKRTEYAHRAAYRIFVGPIPEEMQIDHLCRVRHCVRPSHLEVVTQRENILRGNSPTALNARKTHCDRGHPFDAVGAAGRRACRRCELARYARYNKLRGKRVRTRKVAA